MSLKAQFILSFCLLFFAGLFIWWVTFIREVDMSQISQYASQGRSPKARAAYEHRQAVMHAVLTPAVLKTYQPLSKLSPPRDLMQGADVFVVSGYETNAQEVVNVYVDRSAKPVVLVLSSYEKFIWHVSQSPQTQIKAILVSARNDENYIVLSESNQLVYPLLPNDLPYAYAIHREGGFLNLKAALHDRFGLAKISGYRVSYQLAGEYAFGEEDADDKYLDYDASPMKEQ